MSICMGSAQGPHSVCTVSICMGSAQGLHPVRTVSAQCPFVWGPHRVRTVSALCPFVWGTYQSLCLFVWGPHRVCTLSTQCLHCVHLYGVRTGPTPCLHSVRTVSNCIRWINSNDYLEQLHHSLNFV